MAWKRRLVVCSTVVLTAAPTGCQRDQDDVTVTQSPEREARVVEHAVATLRSLPQIEPDTQPAGVLRFRRDPDEDATFLTGRLVGLRPGEHGLHIHERGDCSSTQAAGGHFNPDGQPHGAPSLALDQRHAGDLGNVTATEQGRAEVKMVLSPRLLERGRYNILGRSIVVHAGRDDLVSQPAGRAGDRVACGVIRAGVAKEEAKAPRVDR